MTEPTVTLVDFLNALNAQTEAEQDPKVRKILSRALDVLGKDLLAHFTAEDVKGAADEEA
jgi:hypothetical protein